MATLALVADETVEPVADFDTFWLLWPKERRVCKKDARREFEKLTADKKLACVIGLVHWRRVWDARGEWEYVIHPHRWIRGERWEDELPSDGRQVTAGSHVLFAKSAELPRGEMPEHVRAMLRKIIGK